MAPGGKENIVTEVNGGKGGVLGGPGTPRHTPWRLPKPGPLAGEPITPATVAAFRRQRESLTASLYAKCASSRSCSPDWFFIVERGGRKVEGRRALAQAKKGKGGKERIEVGREGLAAHEFALFVCMSCF